VPGIRDPYTLVLTVEETELVLQGLGKLPAERSFNLLNKLGAEIGQENQRRQAPAVPPPAVDATQAATVQ
jgi:hypothetical protein